MCLVICIHKLSRNIKFCATSSVPEEEAKWTNKEGREIKKKYQKNTKNISEILDKFYNYNNNVFRFGQVAIKNKVNITKYIIGIEFLMESKINDNEKLKISKIINLIQNNYPQVKIKLIEKKNILEYLKKNIKAELKNVKLINKKNKK